MEPHIERLAEQFSKFPGIGKRQAMRMVYFLLRKNPSYAQELVKNIGTIHQNMKLCTESFQYFYSDDPNETRAPLARNTQRNRQQLMVVEKDTDITSFEKSGVYKGNYFVIGGVMPAVASKYNPVRESEFVKEVTRRIKEDGLEEIIFGLSLNPESEFTRMHLQQVISPLAQEYEVHLSQLGRGLSTGTELEYSDSETLMHAFQARS